MTGLGRMGLVAMIAVGMLLATAPARAFEPAPPAPEAEQGVQQPSRYVMAYDALDVEDHQGYSSEYIFGLTKGVMRSTMVGALKPMVLLFTVPLDIAFLPFAVIGGFFR